MVKKRTSGTLVFLGSMIAGVIIGVSTAAAGPTPFAAPFADDYSHSHISVESDPGDRFYWWIRMNSSLEGDYEPTDLNVWEAQSYATWVDLYWYVTPTLPNPAAAADTTCMAWVDGQRCGRFRVRIKEDAINLTQLQEENLTCHEVGHTVGFRDGGTDGTSCMDGGNNAVIGLWEWFWINVHY